MSVPASGCGAPCWACRRSGSGDALGLTFQQVQKYERGVNRVGASRLFDLSRILDVPISFFYDNMPDAMAGVGAAVPAGERLRRAAGRFRRRRALTKRETLELVRAYYRITDPNVRKRMFDLMKSMGPAEE